MTNINFLPTISFYFFIKGLNYPFRHFNWVFLSNGKNPSDVLRDLDSKEIVVSHNTGGVKYKHLVLSTDLI